MRLPEPGPGAGDSRQRETRWQGDCLSHRAFGHTQLDSKSGRVSYSVYRGVTAGGPYLKIAAGVQGTNYADLRVSHKQTFYYVITAVNGNNESGYSNETVAAIP